MGKPDDPRSIEFRDVVRKSPDSGNEIQIRRMVRPSRLFARFDPDAQLRRAFALEKVAPANDDAYREALNLYRTVRDRREMDIRFALGRDYLNGTNGLPRNLDLVRQRLKEQKSHEKRSGK